ncbi:reverse transcriptase domain-containing protein [Tanacetum coccineum]
MANPDNEPMWAADRIVAPTLGPAITIPETTNEFAIKGNHLTLVKGKQFDGRNKTDPHKHIHKFLSRKIRLQQKLPRPNTNDKPDLEKQLSDFIKAEQSTNLFVKETFMDLKTKLESTTKNHQASIQNLKAKFDILANKQSAQPSGSLPSNTQPNPRGSSSSTFWKHMSRNILETYVPKPYKPRIPYPQCLRKMKMEAHYGKFLYVVRVVRINVPLIDVLAGMPNYRKFLKELVSSKNKLEQISSAILNDECSTIIQNKVPPKLGYPGSFLIPCTFNKTFSCNALADLGASINLMPYSLYAKLSLETLKPKK